MYCHMFQAKLRQKGIMKIDDLNKEIKECNRCRLFETRANALCGEGNLNAKIMLIAQAPGENENKEGKMFIAAPRCCPL